ncbi:MAG: hypothetical protein M3Q79_00660 [bacterium]|nr:hypothetical protein [bacterium]
MTSKDPSSFDNNPTEVKNTLDPSGTPKNIFSHNTIQARSVRLKKLIISNKGVACLILAGILLLMAGGVWALKRQLDTSSGNTTSDTQANGSVDNTGSSQGSDSNSVNPQPNNKPGPSSPVAGGSSPAGGQSDSPPPNPNVGFSAPIGFVGGSLTANAVDGYKLVGGGKFWEPYGRNYGGYGGGTLVKWSDAIASGNSSTYWKNFNSMLQVSSSRGPTKTVWFELLSHGNESDSLVYNSALSVLAEIRVRIPGATIYVSGMNGYDPAGFCRGATAAVSAQMNAIADRLVSEGRALAGPLMANLTTSQVQNDDGCHANDAGKRILGSNLLNFFN